MPCASRIRALQPANILIDNDFNAKVADFGLSREVEEESNSAGIETKIKGTLVRPPELFSPELKECQAHVSVT